MSVQSYSLCALSAEPCLMWLLCCLLCFWCLSPAATETLDCPTSGLQPNGNAVVLTVTGLYFSPSPTVNVGGAFCTEYALRPLLAARCPCCCLFASMPLCLTRCVRVQGDQRRRRAGHDQVHVQAARGTLCSASRLIAA